MAFASVNQRMAIWSLSLDMDKGKVTGELSQITDGDSGEVTPSISADGRFFVYGTTIPGKEDIRIKDLQTGRATALARTEFSQWHPVISKDGSTVVYSQDGPESEGAYVVPATGGAPRRVGPGTCWIFDWTPDLKSVLMGNKSADYRLSQVNVQSGASSDFMSKPDKNV